MAKRFTSTDKFKNVFYRGLKAPYKLLWDYITLECDHAGIWIVDFDVAQLRLGPDAPVTAAQALIFFEGRVFPVSGGKRWFILPFVEFQYGDLNPANRVHASIIQSLKKVDLWDSENNKALTSPLQGAKDKELDKDKNPDKVKNKKQDKVNPFNDIWKSAIDCWMRLLKHVSDGGKFGDGDGTALKEILEKCRIKVETNEPGPASNQRILEFWQHFLGTWDKWEDFHKQPRLPFLNQQFDTIYGKLKSGKTATGKGLGTSNLDPDELRRLAEENARNFSGKPS